MISLVPGKRGLLKGWPHAALVVLAAGATMTGMAVEKHRQKSAAAAQVTAADCTPRDLQLVQAALDASEAAREIYEAAHVAAPHQMDQAEPQSGVKQDGWAREELVAVEYMLNVSVGCRNALSIGFDTDPSAKGEKE